MERTYGELFPGTALGHLSQTVASYFSDRTPLWWLMAVPDPLDPLEPARFPRSTFTPLGCLWLGHAIDQVQGDRHAHLFLLYVDPAHRRQGLGTALLRHGEAWAQQQGDRQMTLQVFCQNQAALSLYQKLGYQPQALTLAKTLLPPSAGSPHPSAQPPPPYHDPRG